MVSINLRELLDILDCDSKFDCWLYKDCEIDDNGIRLRPFDEHTLSLLEGDETRVLDEYKKNIKLNFPCTLDEVKAWAERNGFDDLLAESELFKEWKNAETQKSGTEPASQKSVQVTSDDSKFSGLLNNPKKIDDWFQVIDDMARDFYREYTKIPNEPQAWGLLWTNPPAGYAITTNKDKGKEDCLIMPGAKPLSKSAFTKRWANYTTNKA